MLVAWKERLRVLRCGSSHSSERPENCLFNFWYFLRHVRRWVEKGLPSAYDKSQMKQRFRAGMRLKKKMKFSISKIQCWINMEVNKVNRIKPPLWGALKREIFSQNPKKLKKKKKKKFFFYIFRERQSILLSFKNVDLININHKMFDLLRSFWLDFWKDTISFWKRVSIFFFLNVHKVGILYLQF